MIKGIPVTALLKKAVDESAPTKLLVLRSYRSYEDQDLTWAVDQTIRRIRTLAPDLAVNTMSLPALTILSGGSDDPDSPQFTAGDQWPEVLDAIKRADMILIGAREFGGLPDSRATLVVERMCLKASEIDDPAKALITPKPVGIIVLGGHVATQAAQLLAGSWCRFGAILPARGMVAWCGEGNIYKNEDLRIKLDQLGLSMIGVLKGEYEDGK